MNKSSKNTPAYFQNNNIKCHMSQYYIKIVKDMIKQLLNSSPGERTWLEYTGNDEQWTYDYRSTKRSTFPEWSKFFFEKSKYSNKAEGTEILENGKFLIEKGYNGNKKEFINILKKSLNKKLTSRQANALEHAFQNYGDYINDFEEKYQEKLYIEEDILLQYDEIGNVIGISKKQND